MSITDGLYIALISITIIGIAIGRFPVFRMNRATIALVGSTILIMVQAVSLEEAYQAIDLNTLILLFSMMVINANLRFSGFFKLMVDRIVIAARTPFQLLFLVAFSSGFLSSLFLNDTIVIIFTPIVIEIARSLKRNPVPYLIALATSANVGSVATIVGNPQNMIIGISSGISFARFMFYLTPVAVAGLFIIVILIKLIYPLEFRTERLKPDIVPDFHIFKPLLYKSLAATVFMVAGFFAGVPVTLASLAAAAFLLFTRRIKPERVFAEIDWSLLVFFACLFIITDLLGSYIVESRYLLLRETASFTAMGEFSVLSIILSNLISNVPAVLTLSPLIKMMVHQEKLWLLLAMSTTFAGNLTLLGSVANLIVAELAKKRGVVLSFNEYLKAGLPLTIITVTLGTFWLFLL